MKKTITEMTYIKRVSLACMLASTLFVANALTISPARLELSADPGATATNEFTIINEQSSEQTYYTSVENFEAQGESGTPNFSNTKEGFASWVQVAEKVTVKSGEKIKIPFTVTIPQDADAGGHFAAIFLSTIPPATKGGEVSVGAKVGMLMLLKVSGDIKEEGGVLSFFLKDNGRFVTKLPIDFVYRFNNDGNDRVKPSGTTTIKNMFWITTKEINANKTEGNVLPNSIRRFELTWGDEEPLPASASYFSHVKYEMRNFAMGLYFANLDLNFGTKSSSNTIWFVVLPWHLLIILIAIAGIIFIGLRSAFKRYNKFIIAQARLANAK
ncbi:DUF916 domain-containing protein [Candidatus Gracilibacteria bacterium]|nr:DUF916 domain-containing protein [Candidatus Gracilibacteria bacterium]MCF7898357.1 DUF916 domain-containing protein [Candidatus Paceibacterota bacterium]